MKLNNINLTNFRNYKQININTGADLVLILGDNAAGKTNFLESIYFLSRLKSFRAPDNLLVKNQEDFFNITGSMNVGDGFSLPHHERGGLKSSPTPNTPNASSADAQKKLEAIIQINPAVRRQYKIDDQKIKRGLWQSYSTVLFVPNDLNLFSLGPILRRKYLDETISQIDQAYSLDLESLDHILKQKSALLEQIFENQADASQLEVWNQELVPVAVRITEKRQKFVDFLNAKLSGKVNELTGFQVKLNFAYKRMFAKNEAELLESLKSHEQAEIRSGQNLIGPHRDDFELFKDDLPAMPADKLGDKALQAGQLNLYNSSRGELRAQILGLKLLQAEYLSQTGKKPIILLDDVFSELDETRRIKLIENLSGHQIFITSTEEHHLPKLAKDALVLKVADSQIS